MIELWHSKAFFGHSVRGTPRPVPFFYLFKYYSRRLPNFSVYDPFSVRLYENFAQKFVVWLSKFLNKNSVQNLWKIVEGFIDDYLTSCWNRPKLL
jgi:hypothetical protein